MQIYQSPSNVFKLSKVIVSNSSQLVVGVRSYKFEPIGILVHLDELIDVPICHPLRCHCEVVGIHCYSQQWQNVWMAKGLPGNNLLAEPLRWLASASQLTFSKIVGTHTRDLSKVAH